MVKTTVFTPFQGGEHLPLTEPSDISPQLFQILLRVECLIQADNNKLYFGWENVFKLMWWYR